MNRFAGAFLVPATQPMTCVVVNDASCLIDLRKGRLLPMLCRLPYRFVVPLPIRESELPNLTSREWESLDHGGMETHDLPPDQMKDVFALKQFDGTRPPGYVTNECELGELPPMRNAPNGLGFRRVSGSLGAEVSGIDLSSELDDRTIAAIRTGLLEHLVLVFRDQSLEPGSLAAFARRFGALNRHPYVKPLDGHPDVFRIVKEPDDIHHFGNGWHSDLSYARHPAMATMLYGTEIPPHGGDTLFADMRAAYRTLSDGMKRTLDGLVAVFSNERTYGPDAARFQHGVKQMEVAQQATITRVEHPVVRTHPETGVKALYLNPLHTVGFKDMTAEESQPLIDYLCRHATRPEFVCRVQWRPGSLAFWDNRATLHYAVDDFAGHRRVMTRVTLEGDRPR